MKPSAATLLAWYAQVRRDLPWRRTKDAWAIWVSEIMLQQTRVEAVRERFDAFLARYGEPRAFALASDDEVLSAWRGLGYYRRARALHEAARIVVDDHDGEVPRDLDALERLPGIGAYTVGAIASIAFDIAAPAIDGNVERVLARVLGIEAAIKSQPARATMRAAIAELHEAGAPGDVNQALMELGATTCLPRAPRCELCPWHDACMAKREGKIDDLPQTKPREAGIAVETEVLVARDEDRVLVHRRPAGTVNAGQYCLPSLGIPRPLATELGEHLRATLSLDAAIGPRRASFRHAITKWRMEVHVREALQAPRSDSLLADHDLRYVSESDASIPTTTIVRKALRALVKLR